MMFNIELFEKKSLDYSIFQDIPLNFSKSIEFNTDINSEINKVYQRTLTNQAKFILGLFHLNIFNSLELIVINTGEMDDFVLDVTSFIADYFNEIDYKLNIKSIKDFDEFNYILKLSSIIIESAIEVNDMELIFESFFQIQSRFKKANLINEFKFNEIET